MEFFERFNATIKKLFGNDGQEIESSFFNHAKSEAPSNVTKGKKKSKSLDESLVRLGDTYLHLKHYDCAMDCFREAVRINPDNTMAYNRLIVIPSYLLESKTGFPQRLPMVNVNDKSQMILLSLNDTFRQTFVGGYVILSRVVSRLSERKLRGVFKIIRNLSGDYFLKHSGRLRDHGVIKHKKSTYVWMINHCYSKPAVSTEKCPVLIIMTRKEFHALKVLLHKNLFADK
ncbi:MAG: tetratricopeptide repeat protein [Fibrobacteria bacterium]|nr:tetratricopeptide repeat protein [Fibrobacteria bacterium]